MRRKTVSMIALALLLAVVPLSTAIQQPASMAASPSCCTLSVPAAAFRPRCSYIEYDTNGIRLTTLEDGNHPGICTTAGYSAPIYLPQGAQVRKVTLRARDAWGGDIGDQVLLKLVCAVNNSYSVLAEVGTGMAAAPGDTAVSTTNIAGGTINNEQCAYYLGLDMRKPLTGDITDLMFYQALIEYGFDMSMPLAQHSN